MIGPLPDTVAYPASYFEKRNITLHCENGALTIEAGSFWGQGVKVITAGHRLEGRETVVRPVVVKAGAFIGSYAILYNCVIGEGAVVAAGTVVRSCEVAPFTAVAGNPARVIARVNNNGKWTWADLKWRTLK